jgi:hypothetical protein
MPPAAETFLCVGWGGMMRERKKKLAKRGDIFFVKNRNNNYFSPFSEKKRGHIIFF